MIRGILFDLDGVIVDTLHYHYLAWKHMFEKRGGSPVSEHTVLLNEGRNSREILPILMNETGVTIPDPYLTAARQLGLSPKECLVVENAPLGIESAHNAGMQCAAIETTLGREYLASADSVFRDIDNLLSLPMLGRTGIQAD